MIKKITILFSLLLIPVICLFWTVAKTKADSEVDQQNITGTGALAINSHPVSSQSFRPAKSKFDKAAINIMNPAGTLNCIIEIYNGEDWDPIKYINSQAAVDGWNTFDFADFDLTVDARYRIVIDASDVHPLWYYSEANPYPNGYAYSSAWPDDYTKDFQFKTYGYDPGSGEQPGEDSGNQSPDTTGTTGSGETLGTATTSIAKPLELTAAYFEADRGVKLAWKASTTADIDGYKIFRSESSDKGYTKIKETKKDKLDYIDQDIAANKTYYYQLRAYKGDQQSYSSNTASAKIPDDIAPAKPKNLTVIEATTNTISVKWAKSTAADLKSYTISLYKGDEKIRTKDLGSDQSSYHFISLDSGTLYKVELITKNDKDKTSSPAITYGATQYPEEVAAFFDRLTIVGCILIFGLLGFLVYRVIISRKAKTA